MSLLFVVGLALWMIGFGIGTYIPNSGPLFHVVGGLLVLLSPFLAV
jgi:hypothetical protein